MTKNPTMLSGRRILLTGGTTGIGRANGFVHQPSILDIETGKLIFDAIDKGSVEGYRDQRSE